MRKKKQVTIRDLRAKEIVYALNQPKNKDGMTMKQIINHLEKERLLAAPKPTCKCDYYNKFAKIQLEAAVHRAFDVIRKDGMNIAPKKVIEKYEEQVRRKNKWKTVTRRRKKRIWKLFDKIKTPKDIISVESNIIKGYERAIGIGRSIERWGKVKGLPRQIKNNTKLLNHRQLRQEIQILKQNEADREAKDDYDEYQRIEDKQDRDTDPEEQKED